MARKKKAAVEAEPVEDVVTDFGDVVVGGAAVEIDGDAGGVYERRTIEIHPGPVEPGDLVIGEGTAADVIIQAGANADAEMEIKQAAMWLTKWRNKHA
jgi:hypothetical protein